MKLYGYATSGFSEPSDFFSQVLLHMRADRSLLPGVAKSVLDAHLGAGWYIPHLSPKSTLVDKVKQGRKLMVSFTKLQNSDQKWKGIVQGLWL